MSAAPPDSLRLERREDGAAVIWIDDPASSVNTLRAELAGEVQSMLGALAGEPLPRCVVIASGKPDGFIAGADLEMLDAVSDAAEGEALSRLSQSVQARLEALPVPSVAAIHGDCLGGGLELALACTARVASDAPATALGLPEVRLGLLPGGGGTQRLPRIVGVHVALDMMLTGRSVDARRALRTGLVDAVVDPAGLLEAAVRRGLAMARLWRPGHPGLLDRAADAPFTRRGFVHLLLGRNPVGRHVLFGRAGRRVRSQTRGNYPAPERILEVTRIGLARGMTAGLDAEARAFGELAVSPQARELIGIFFASRAAAKDPGVDEPVTPLDVRRVGVLGAGLMGAGIARVSALDAGLDVTVKEHDGEALERGLAGLGARLDARVARGRMSSAERDAVLSRLHGTLDDSGLEGCDVVIEAVFEDLDLKRGLLRAVEGLEQPCVFASNTSSIPIASIAARARHPERVVGMHYFSPVERMPLLEVVVTPQTAPAVTATCVALGKRQGKTVIVVNDGPGFYTSRILAPYLNEAAWLLAEGAMVEAVDEALADFGFPIGPLALVDEVGLDVAHKVAAVLASSFGERMRAPPGMAALVAAGRLGKKSGRGLYLHDGERRPDPEVYRVLGASPGEAPDAAAMARRCVLQMVNEACRCLGEGILRSPRDGDIGAVFGLGFPPFLGGPFRYVDRLGAGEVLAALEGLEAAHGGRFAAAPLLTEVARAGGTLHA